VSPRVEPALLQRIENLTGEDGACCVDDLQAEAAQLRSPEFRRALLQAKALGDESRLLAAMLLKRHDEMCGCEIQAALRLTHATVSHHMGVLQQAQIVSMERRGKWAYYRLVPESRASIP